jgi:alpha-D-ribose 1-methylphosphonate 5-triphosphate synthase subunit PhnI
LIEPDGEMPLDHVPGDITREPLEFPMARDMRLQALARGDEGFLLALGYSTQRGYGRNHPFVGEIRIGEVELELDVPELGFRSTPRHHRVTECQMVNQFNGSAKAPPQFTRGYGLVFGQSERKAMAMALVRPRLARHGVRRGRGRRRAGRGIRHLALRQCPGDRLRRASETAALRRLPGRARPRAPHARRI